MSNVNTNAIKTSANSSKRNIINRKYCPILNATKNLTKPLPNTNTNNVSNNQSLDYHPKSNK